MPGTYVVNHKDPSVAPITIPPQSVDTSTSLPFFGYRYPVYGERLMENFLHLLENFAAPTAPENPVNGQIWMDTSTGQPVPRFYAKTSGLWMAFGTGGGTTPPEETPIVTINGSASGASIEVTPGGTISVRVQNVPVGDSISWSGGSAGDTLITNLQTNAGTSTNATEFTAVVGVGSTARTVAVTATIGAASFVFDVVVTATAKDFVMDTITGFSVVNGATATTQLVVNLSGITGDVGSTVVSVTGSGLVATPPSITSTLNGTTSATASYNFTLNTSALGVGTHTITASAVSATVTRSRTFVITVTASGTLPNPVLTATATAGDAGEISLDRGFGFIATNIDIGASISVTLSGYADDPVVFDAALVDTMRVSPGSTTINYQFGPAESAYFDNGPWVINGAIQYGTAQRTLQLQVMVNGRSSSPLTYTMRRPVSLTGNAYDSAGSRIIVDQTSRSLTVSYYVPEYGGSASLKPGNSYLTFGYATRQPLDGLDPVVPVSGVYSHTLTTTGTNADTLYQIGGNTTQVMYGLGASVLDKILCRVGLDITPSVGAAAPPVSLTLGDLDTKVSMLWVNTLNTTYGSLIESGDIRRNEVTVPLSTIVSSGLKLWVHNMDIVGSTTNTNIYATGAQLMGPNWFNESTLSGADTVQVDTIQIAARSMPWSKVGGYMVYQPATFQAFFDANPLQSKIGMRVAVGVEREGIYYVKTYIALYITRD